MIAPRIHHFQASFHVHVLVRYIHPAGLWRGGMVEAVEANNYEVIHKIFSDGIPFIFTRDQSPVIGLFRNEDFIHNTSTTPLHHLSLLKFGSCI